MTPGVVRSPVTESVVPTDRECRVLLLAPTGKDAALIGQRLAGRSMACHKCAGIGELSEELRAGAGVGILAEEGLTGVSLAPLLSALAEQPPWSDFPLILLTQKSLGEDDTVPRLLALFGPNANITLLDRFPFTSRLC